MKESGGVTPGYVLFASWRFCGSLLHHCATSAAVQLVTRSRIVHCAFGWNGVFADATLTGVKFWPAASIPFYPNLFGVFRVPVHGDLTDLMTRCEQGVGRRVRPYCMLRRLLTGRPRGLDCLTIPLAGLRAGGVRVPRHVRAPVDLYRYLLRRTFPHVIRPGFPEECFASAVGRFVAD